MQCKTTRFKTKILKRLTFSQWYASFLSSLSHFHYLMSFFSYLLLIIAVCQELWPCFHNILLVFNYNLYVDLYAGAAVQFYNHAKTIIILAYLGSESTSHRLRNLNPKNPLKILLTIGFALKRIIKVAILQIIICFSRALQSLLPVFITLWPLYVLNFAVFLSDYFPSSFSSFWDLTQNIFAW